MPVDVVYACRPNLQAFYHTSPELLPAEGVLFAQGVLPLLKTTE